MARCLAERVDAAAGRQLLLRSIPERDFQQAVIDTARLLGWRVQFHWSERHSPKGWPDLTLIRPPRLLFVECKTERGRLTAAQKSTLALLVPVPHIECSVWRPRDLDQIQRVLARDGD